jgi:hypothetical protein
MNEERMKILNMVSEGKITAEEADKLMEKLDEQERDFSSDAWASGESEPDGSPASLQKSALPKYIRVRVEPKEGTKSDHGKVKVRVPLTLIRAGMNIASLMPKEVHDKIDDAMGDQGLGFKLSDIDDKNIDDILLALRELVVDVDTDNETVKVYCE